MFFLLQMTIQCVPEESDFEAFTITNTLFGNSEGKLSAANTPRNLYFKCLHLIMKFCS